MSELQDFIAEQSGITLHRHRVLKAFATVHDSPLLEMLLNQTRPPLRKAATHVRPHPHLPPLAPAIIRRGMVNYRRERFGP
jgi:hypothetical protein